MSKYFVLLNFLFLVFFLSCNPSVSKMNMQAPYGGRAVAVTFDPANENNVWVGTPTGGMYESPDGGNTWAKVLSMPENALFDIKFSPTDSKVIIATAIEDTHSLNGGGIWISSDGGNTWDRKGNIYSQRRVPAPYSAYGISFMPGTQEVIVGTDSGIAISPDLNSWTYVNPLKNGKLNGIFSVLALSNGRILTYGENGIWMSDDGGNFWYQDETQLGFGVVIKNALCVSPNDNNVIFFTGDNSQGLYYSVDGGHHFKLMPVDFTSFPGRNGYGRIPYVKVCKSSSGDSRDLDLYFSYIAVLGKKTIRWTGTDFNFSKKWTQVNIVHRDESDLVFAPDGMNPLYATNDGGVEKYMQKNKSWVQIGNPAHGYNSLQVYDVKCLSPSNSDYSNDLYFGTQDNEFYHSADDGVTWSVFTCCEGGNFQGPLSDAHLPSSTKFTFFDASSGNFYLNGLDDTLTIINYPVNPNYTPSLMYAGTNTFCAIANNYDLPGTEIYVSFDNCATWFSKGPMVAFEHAPIQYPFIINSYHPSLTLAVQYLSYDANTIGLVQVSNLFDGSVLNVRVTPIPLPPNCQIGQYGQGWEKGLASFAVDPDDTNSIIIADVHNNMIYQTSTHGQSWIEQTQAYNLITNNGEYRFNSNNSNRQSFEVDTAQVSCMAFDPWNSNIILIGSAEAGIVYSKDRGDSWNKIEGSEQIPNITSFSFAENGEMYASTWGGGIWSIFL